MRWFGHIKRRDSAFIGRKFLEMELPARRKRGRPQIICLDRVNAGHAVG